MSFRDYLETIFKGLRLAINSAQLLFFVSQKRHFQGRDTAAQEITKIQVFVTKQLFIVELSVRVANVVADHDDLLT